MNKKFKKKNFFNWLKIKYDIINTVVSSLFSIGISMLASFLYSLTTETEGPNWLKICTIILILTVAFLIIILLAIMADKLKKCIFKTELTDNLVTAFLNFRDLEILEQQDIEQYFNDKPYDAGKMRDWHLHCLKQTIHKCYDYFTNTYSHSEHLLDEIRFEVTYMTLSYKDGKITIAESCNKERKKPKSMQLREKDPSIYDGTETDKIYQEYYRSRNTSIHIISNTNVSESNYKSLYEKQTERIKSSIIIPVLSCESKLLGTLVVHCNNSGFFKVESQNYWEEILRPYVVEIEKHKIALDYFVRDATVEKPF